MSLISEIQAASYLFASLWYIISQVEYLKYKYDHNETADNDEN